MENHAIYKRELDEMGIKHIKAADFCGVGKTVFSLYINGKTKMSKRFECKIREFILLKNPNANLDE